MKRLTTLIACAILVVGCGGEPPQDETNSGSATTATGSGMVKLSPERPQATHVLEARLHRAAPEGSQVRFVWKRNGEEIFGQNTSTLSPGNFRKGDVISVDVWVASAGMDESLYGSANVKVMNAPPKVISATTTMGHPTEVSAHVDAVDPDGDLLSYRYQWYRNGTALRGETDSALDASYVSRGDEVYAEVVVSDDESSSIPSRTAPLLIENHAPTIHSSPTPPSPDSREFRYRVVADDSDGDDLSYELTSAPPGMRIDSDGEIMWMLPTAENRSGSHAIKVRVSDPHGGEAYQEFSITFRSRGEEE